MSLLRRRNGMLVFVVVYGFMFLFSLVWLGCVVGYGKIGFFFFYWDDEKDNPSWGGEIKD